MTARLHRRRTRGVSLLEFVIVFPMAALFVLGLIQTGFVYMAKLTLNHATFMAARAGSLHNAQQSVIKEAVIRGLTPFYQDSTDTNTATRLGKAYVAAQLDAIAFLQVDKPLSPSAEAFADFGVKDPSSKVVYIPNDHLEWRDLSVGTKSKVNIRDANLLKIRVVYGYHLKVPLIAGVMKRVMCSGSIGVQAWGNVTLLDSLYGLKKPDLCLRYYLLDRMPIESTAIVEMQSPAFQP
jgi:hypothetical protein